MTATTATRSAALVLLVSMTLIMTGCSSSPSAAPGTSPTRTSVVAPGASVPFTLANDARGDVSTHPCRQTANGWVFGGTVKNPAHEEKSFQMVVDFVRRVGSTVIGTTVVNVPSVAPGATAAWSVTGVKGQSGVACVVRLAQLT